MACSCYDELAALYVKFEQIQDLVESIFSPFGDADEYGGNLKRGEGYYGAPYRKYPLSIKRKISEIFKVDADAFDMNDIYEITIMLKSAGWLDN